MSVWTNIEGTVSIYKKDKVSVKEVIYSELTDEAVVNIETEDFPDYYRHTINCMVGLDGYGFIRNYEKFLMKLKPMKCGGLDLSVTLRFL